jgi:hypothetical protein
MQNATKRKKAMKKELLHLNMKNELLHLNMKKELLHLKKKEIVYIRQSTPGPTEDYEHKRLAPNPGKFARRVGFPAHLISIVRHPRYMGDGARSGSRKA